MSRLQALIWDVDGTLAETERDGHRVAFNLAFEALGVPWRWSEARYGELLSVTGGRERLLHDMAGQALAPVDPAARAELARRLHQLKNAHYAEIVAAGHIPLRPDVAALMADCRHARLPMAIATTTSRSNVEALLGAHLGADWSSQFAAVVCAEDAPLKKPDPQAYRMVLQQLGMRADEVLAIEDSSPGVAACVAAGVPVVVTRSVYFADADVAGALAVGPGLDTVSGWRPAAEPQRNGGRIGLPQLTAWWTTSLAGCQRQ